MNRKNLIIIVALLSLSFVALLILTDPTKLSSFLLIIPFILLFGILWIAGFLLLRHFGISRFRSMRLGLLVGGLPVGLLLLQSIGQLTIRDFVTILAFFAIAYFYIARLTATQSE